MTQTGDVMSVTRTLSDGSQITLWASVADARNTLDQVRTTLLISGVVLLALSAVALGPVIGRALVPLDQITATARSITGGDRGRRLRPDRPGTELGRTATARSTRCSTRSRGPSAMRAMPRVSCAASSLMQRTSCGRR